MSGRWLFAWGQRLVALPRVASPQAWAISAGIIIAATVLKLVLDSIAIEPVPPYVTFYPTVVGIAFLGGVRAGLAAAAATLLLAWYLFLPVENSFIIADRNTAMTLAIYAITATFLAVAVGFARLSLDGSIASEANRRKAARESVHRIKNLLAVVQAITNKVASEVNTVEQYRSVMTSRLSALSVAQDVLIRGDWKDVELGELVESALAPFLPNPGLHIDRGPPAIVSARHVSGLSMALYELCTNAMKYGALAAGRGPVALRWRCEGRDCILEWQEETPIVAAHGESLGTQLIRLALSRSPGTEVIYTVADNRVHAVFRWPFKP
jgi:two-component sensor histidine kinase